MNTQPVPSLFDPPPTIERRNESYHTLQPEDMKLKKHRILYILWKHPLLRYDEIPPLYKLIYGEGIKESSCCGRLNEMNEEEGHLGYVNTDNEKLNIEGNKIVTAYRITDKGIKHLQQQGYRS